MAEPVVVHQIEAAARLSSTPGAVVITRSSVLALCEALRIQHEALTAVTEDGCGQGRPTCMDEYPADASCWCGPCWSSAALAAVAGLVDLTPKEEA